MAGIAGSFIGLVLGGVLGPIGWRYVFLVSVPFGVLGTIWSYLKLRELGVRRPAALDWWGNATFGAGLIAVLVGITYGIQPWGRHTMGWTSPLVIGLIASGLAVLVIFCVIETRVAEPMFQLALFKIRPFTAGNLASLLSGLGRGGLMFILIIWLQGIYLPIHGYSFSRTPLWAGIAMLPLTVGAPPAAGTNTPAQPAQIPAGPKNLYFREWRDARRAASPALATHASARQPAHRRLSRQRNRPSGSALVNRRAHVSGQRMPALLR